jgi:hypothetical protein
MSKISKSNRSIIFKGKAKEDVVSFLVNAMERKFTDAERNLENLRKRNIGDPEFKEGYITALEGILLSIRSGDERDFFNKINFEQKKIKNYKKEFQEFNKSTIRTNYDIGFFSAWNDLIAYRIKK